MRAHRLIALFAFMGLCLAHGYGETLHTAGRCGDGSAYPDVEFRGNTLYAAWNDNGTAMFNSSADGGRSWGAPLAVSSSVAGDPAIALDGSGNIYLVLSRGGSVYCARSVDGGASFADERLVASGVLEFPDIAIKNNSIYVTTQDTYYIYFSSTTAANFSFGGKKKIASGGNYYPRKRSFIAASDSGTNVYVTYKGDFGTGGHKVYCIRSLDRGATFGTPVMMAGGYGTYRQHVAASGEYYVLVSYWDDTGSGTGRIVYSRSTNSGTSFTARTIENTSLKNGDWGVNGATFDQRTSIAVRGIRVLLAWDVHADSAAYTGTRFLISGDLGSNWGATTYLPADGGNPCAALNERGEGTLVYTRPDGTAYAVCVTSAPPVVADFSAATGESAGKLTVSWTAPDSGVSGYSVRYATYAFDDIACYASSAAAVSLPAFVPNAPVGPCALTGFALNTTYYLAVRSVNPLGQFSFISNVSTATSYDIDLSSPAAITDLAVEAMPSAFRLTWTAPGNDGDMSNLGAPPDGGYLLKYSSTPIRSEDDFMNAGEYAQSWAPRPAGTREMRVLTGFTPGRRYYFALKAHDKAYNWPEMSNAVSQVFKDIALTDAYPRMAANGGTAALSLCGKGLDGAMTVRLKRAGQADIAALSIDTAAPVSARCLFDLAGAGTGMWDIEIVRDGQEARLPAALYVYDAAAPDGEWTWDKRAIGYCPGTQDVVSGDIDGDGEIELYRVDGSTIYQIKGGGGQWTGTPLFSEGTGRLNTLVAGDADNDGRAELYAGGSTYVYRYRFDESSWNRSVAASGLISFRNPVLGDADNDGCRELYYFEGSSLYRLSAAGAGQFAKTYVPLPPGVGRWTTAAGMTIGDADNDGAAELYVADAGTTGVYRIALDGAWRYSRIETRGAKNPCIADGNNDGKNELYASGENAGLWQYSFNGTAWETATVGQVARTCGLGMDADGDGKVELCGLEPCITASRCGGTEWTAENLDPAIDMTRLAGCGGFNDGRPALYAYSRGSAMLYELRKRKPPVSAWYLPRSVYGDSGALGTLGCYDDRAWEKSSTIALCTDYTAAREGKSSLRAHFSVVDQGYAGLFVAAAGTENMYPFYFADGALAFSLRFSAAPPADLTIGIRSQNVDADTARSNVNLSRYVTGRSSGTWYDVMIPLADFIKAEPATDFNQTKIFFNLAYVADRNGGPYEGDVWVDNVQWVRPDRCDRIRIVPEAAALGPEDTRTFSAVFYNGAGDAVVPAAAPDWAVAGTGKLESAGAGRVTFTPGPGARDGSAASIVCRIDGKASSAQVTVSTRTWSRSYEIYRDSGLPYGSDICVWEEDGAFELAEMRDAGAPEGSACIRQVVDSAYGGWGVAYTTAALNGVRDLSAFAGGVLSFRVKTPVPVQIAMQDTGPGGCKKTVDVSAYGWDGTDTWQEIRIPVADFLAAPGVDVTKVHAPFLIAAGTSCCFCVDAVRLATNVTSRGPLEVRIVDGKLLVDNEPFVIRGVNGAAVPPGGDRTHDWSLDRESYRTDIPLLKAMGANVVRLYAPPANKDAVKEISGSRIYFIMTYPVSASDIASPENVKAGFLNMVRTWMDSPGVLAWCIGNEVNRELSGSDLAAWYRIVEDCARAAHEAEACAGIPGHPVTTANAELGAIGDAGCAADDASLPDLDFWSIQAYRGPGFGTLFDDYRALSKKPLLVSEFGCDAWNGTSGAEDQETQSRYLLSQWEEIRSRLKTAERPQGVTLGGCVFQWCDGWYKSAANAAGNEGHDTSCDWTNPAYADPAMNEEWWGICAVSSAARTQRYPRKAYYALGAAWNQPPLLSAGIYSIADDSPAAAISWDVREVPAGWKTAQQYLRLDCPADFDGWGIQVYTDNCAEDACPRFYAARPVSYNPAGLVRCSDRKKTLKMCWRITDAPVRDPREFEIAERLDGTGGKLFTPVKGDRYACYLWMKDRRTPALPAENTTPFVEGEDYVTVWDSARGVHHGENEWTAGESSPNYLYFGARFSDAVTPEVYRTGKLIVELFVE